MLAQSYRGNGGSFGYPASPNPADQKQLLALLDAEKIGISSLYVHHPWTKGILGTGKLEIALAQSHIHWKICSSFQLIETIFG